MTTRLHGRKNRLSKGQVIETSGAVSVGLPRKPTTCAFIEGQARYTPVVLALQTHKQKKRFLGHPWR